MFHPNIFVDVCIDTPSVMLQCQHAACNCISHTRLIVGCACGSSTLTLTGLFFVFICAGKLVFRHPPGQVEAHLYGGHNFDLDSVIAHRPQQRQVSNAMQCSRDVADCPLVPNGRDETQLTTTTTAHTQLFHTADPCVLLMMSVVWCAALRIRMPRACWPQIPRTIRSACADWPKRVSRALR